MQYLITYTPPQLKFKESIVCFCVKHMEFAVSPVIDTANIFFISVYKCLVGKYLSIYRR